MAWQSQGRWHCSTALLQDHDGHHLWTGLLAQRVVGPHHYHYRPHYFHLGYYRPTPHWVRILLGEIQELFEDSMVWLPSLAYVL